MFASLTPPRSLKGQRLKNEGGCGRAYECRVQCANAERVIDQFAEVCGHGNMQKSVLEGEQAVVLLPGDIHLDSPL